MKDVPSLTESAMNKSASACDLFIRRHQGLVPTNSGASGDGLEVQNSEAFQGEVWRGRGVRDVEKPDEFIAFPHLPGLELWAPGHIRPPAISCRLRYTQIPLSPADCSFLSTSTYPEGVLERVT